MKRIGIVCLVVASLGLAGCGSNSDLRLLSLDCGSGSRFVFPQVATGEVANTSGQPLQGVVAEMTFNGPFGSVLETVSVKLNRVLAPGEQCRFKTPFIADANLSGCEVRFLDPSGRVIPHRAARSS